MGCSSIRNNTLRIPIACGGARVSALMRLTYRDRYQILGREYQSLTRVLQYMGYKWLLNIQYLTIIRRCNRHTGHSHLWGPFHERFFHRNSNSIEISFCSHLNCNEVIATKFAYGTTAMLSWHVQNFSWRYDTKQWSYTNSDFHRIFNCDWKLIFVKWALGPNYLKWCEPFSIAATYILFRLFSLCVSKHLNQLSGWYIRPF